MTVNEMKDTIARTRGLEDYFTIGFFKYCEIHTEKEINSYYNTLLALPFEDEED